MSNTQIANLWQRNRRRVANFSAGLARRRLKPVRAKFYDHLWARAANEIGAKALGLPDGLTRIDLGAQATFVRQSNLMLDSEITQNVFANKALHYELMAQKSLRLPPFKRFTMATLNDALEFKEQCQGPIVIKPANGTGGGHGVVTNVRTQEEAEAAAKHAAGYDPILLAEEQLSGSVFRLVYLNGQFIDAVRRDPPTVVGDGSSTIAQLIKQENLKRTDAAEIRALSPLVIDQCCKNTLAGFGHSTHSIPAQDESVQVKLAVNENASPQNHVVRDEVHEDIVEMGTKVVRDFGLMFAGLDVTSDDISAPIADGNTYFNEININPGIHHHYLVSNPEKSADLAVSILDQLFSAGRGTIKL